MFGKINALGFLVAAGFVAAESHTVNWWNNCGFPITPSICANAISGYCYHGPTLGNSASAGYTHNGPLPAFITYASGNGITCNTNGEGCMITEGTLQNLSSCEGCNSVDLSLIPPHAFNFGNSFQMSDGSGGHGCESANCNTAFHSDGNDGAYQIGSNGQNVGINLVFCGTKGNF